MLQTTAVNHSYHIWLLLLTFYFIILKFLEIVLREKIMIAFFENRLSKPIQEMGIFLLLKKYSLALKSTVIT